MNTSNKTREISISTNDKDVTGPILIPSTFVEADTVTWRQWHHWNYIDNIATNELKKGLQTISLQTVDIRDMNYNFINFECVTHSGN